MGNGFFRGMPLVAVILATVAVWSVPAFGQGSGLVGSKTMNFTLPSQQGNLVSYGERYYGRYHLVVTFFPAAFTPV